eukprot:TRINITY_DN984_c5_g1_i1.p1 TRINITY_DN984_c5_g1~~TRINITY_DN984_c5_g1_i1.p1  ORF type:complete len:379 (+),score=62.10 TRINITY_DN984_c5_g1_i1:169-1137(+)
MRRIVRTSTTDYQRIRQGKAKIFEELARVREENPVSAKIYHEAVQGLSKWGAHSLIKDILNTMKHEGIDPLHETYAAALKCYSQKFSTQPNLFDELWNNLPEESIRDPSLWAFRIWTRGESVLQDMSDQSIELNSNCYASLLHKMDPDSALKYYNDVIPKDFQTGFVAYAALKKHADAGDYEKVCDKKNTLSGIPQLKWYKLRLKALQERCDWDTSMEVAKELEGKGVLLDSEAYSILLETIRQNCASGGNVKTWVLRAEALISHSEGNGAVTPSLYYRLLTLYEEHGLVESKQKLLDKMSLAGLRTAKMQPSIDHHGVTFA